MDNLNEQNKNYEQLHESQPELTDKEVLHYYYGRLIHCYNENPEFSLMTRLKQIIDNYIENNFKEKSNLCICNKTQITTESNFKEINHCVDYEKVNDLIYFKIYGEYVNAMEKANIFDSALDLLTKNEIISSFKNIMYLCETVKLKNGIPIFGGVRIEFLKNQYTEEERLKIIRFLLLADREMLTIKF